MHLSTFRLLIVVITFLASSLFWALGVAQGRDEQSRDEFSHRLILVSKQVDKTEQEIIKLKNEYSALLSERKQLEGALIKSRDEEKRLSESLKVRVQQKAQLEKELSAAQLELGRREAKVKARIRALYVSSVYHSFGDVLFHTRGDEVERIAVYAKALKNHDEALFKDLRVSVDRVTNAQKELGAADKNEREAQELLRAKKSELESAIQRTKTISEEVAQKKKGAERALTKLREEADHLESLLEQLTKSEVERVSPQTDEEIKEEGSDESEQDGPTLSPTTAPATAPSSPQRTPQPTIIPTAVPSVETPVVLTDRTSDAGVPPTSITADPNISNDEEVTLAGLFIKGKSVQSPVAFRVLQPFGKGKGSSFADIVTSKGVDGEAEVGARVEAIAAGRVAFVGPMPGFGTVVILDHGKRHYSLYGRLGESMVSKGMVVQDRRAIGTTGELSEKGRNFYLEVRKDGKAIDPAVVVKGLR